MGSAPTRTIRWWAMVYAVAVTPVDFGTIGLTSSSGPDLLRWALLMPVWLLPMVAVMPRWPQLFEALRRPPWSWLVLWAAMGPVSVLWATAPRQAILIGLSIAGLTLFAGWYVYTVGWFEFATAVVMGLTLALGAGLLFDLGSGALIDGTVEGRAPGLTTGPTTLGRLAALNIVISAGLVTWTRAWNRRMLLPWIAIATSVAALAFAETRTAMVAPLVGLAYGGLRRLSPLNRWLVVAATAILAVAAIGISSAFTEVLSFGERGDPTTVSGRTDIWPFVVDLIARRPLLGYGWGAEGEIFEQAVLNGRFRFVAGTTHSIVLAPLLSGGVVGFGLFATAIGSAVHLRRRVDPWVLAPVLTILFGGLTEAIIHKPSVSTIILSGALAAVARVSWRARKPPGRIIGGPANHPGPSRRTNGRRRPLEHRRRGASPAVGSNAEPETSVSGADGDRAGPAR